MKKEEQKIEKLQNAVEMYEILAEDVKHQIMFIDDINTFDITYLKDILSRMEKKQKEIRIYDK